VAVSGTGDASNTAGNFSCGGNGGVGCISMSGTGSASNEAERVSCGDAGCIAVSATGHASNSQSDEPCCTTIVLTDPVPGVLGSSIARHVFDLIAFYLALLWEQL
jgi:hypothetical protein